MTVNVLLKGQEVLLYSLDLITIINYLPSKSINLVKQSVYSSYLMKHDTMKIYGECIQKYRHTHVSTHKPGVSMKVGGQLHAPATLHPCERTPLPIGQEAITPVNGKKVKLSLSTS
jgi:hypothetical protein